MLAVGIVVGCVGLAMAAGVLRSGADEGARCGAGFEAKGPRCLPAGRDDACPPPLERTGRGCDAPDVRLVVPAVTLTVGSSDWEAEGHVASRTLVEPAFRIDAFEVTVARWGGAADGLRAASGMTRDEARAFCRARGGDLPTEDQWIVAAVAARSLVGEGPHQPTSPLRRYPWGDTGAVCRRAAWGLASGPCARGASGPDSVGAHPDGDSSLGLHDLAGNVAEWVIIPSGPTVAVAKGGSWASAEAAELRVWARLELPSSGGDPRVGLRCTYPL